MPRETSMAAPGSFIRWLCPAPARKHACLPPAAHPIIGLRRDVLLGNIPATTLIDERRECGTSVGPRHLKNPVCCLDRKPDICRIAGHQVRPVGTAEVTAIPQVDENHPPQRRLAVTLVQGLS